MDARKKKVLMVLGVASLILIWRVYSVVTEHMPSAVQADPLAVEADVKPKEAAALAAAKARERETADLLKAQEQAARQPWGRDPFAEVVAKVTSQDAPPSENPTVAQPPPAPRLSFTGVARVDDEWRAIVSGQFVRIGDVVETDFRVSQITKRSITFQSRGWSLRYELGQDAPLVSQIGRGGQLLSEKP